MDGWMDMHACIHAHACGNVCVRISMCLSARLPAYLPAGARVWLWFVCLSVCWCVCVCLCLVCVCWFVSNCVYDRTSCAVLWHWIGVPVLLHLRAQFLRIWHHRRSTKATKGEGSGRSRHASLRYLKANDDPPSHPTLLQP